MKLKLFGIFFSLSTFLYNISALEIDYPKDGTQYEPMYFRFAENLNFVNPFDLETNKAELNIVLPDFTKQTLSFFYDGVNDKNVELWEARYTPKQYGNYAFFVIINGTVKEQFEIKVNQNKNKKQGGLVVSDKPSLFRYESGEPFRGIGMNVCWTPDYEYYFKKMQAAGMNFTRIWICPWHLPLEWAHTGLGKYDLESARRLDEILKLAQKYNIYILLCIDYHGVAQKGAGFFKEDKWRESPYNKINGGPCLEAYELFTDDTAKNYFKKKYKYILSRYGFSANIAAWEIYNEADLMAGRAIPMNRWHIEIGEYLHTINVHDRLVTTSGTRSYPEKLIDAFKSPVMDFIMYHQYNVLNMAPFIIDLHEMAQEYYNKPFVLGEFGIDYRGADITIKEDPQHVGLHNGIWAGLFAETPVIPLTWWWDNYIEPHNLWYQFEYLSSFASQIDLNVNHLTFKTLLPGTLEIDSTKQVEVMIRCIYYGENATLWLKNDYYYWSLVNQGVIPQEIGNFYQVVPNLVPGKYSIKWFDPQNGTFLEKISEAEANNEGTLRILVPSFSKDLACLIERK